MLLLWTFFNFLSNVTKTLQSCDNPFVILWLKTVENVSTVIFDTNLTLYCWHPVFVSLKKAAFLLKKSWSFALKLRNHLAWSNTFPAKVRKHQETWLPKSQQKLGNFAKENWLETRRVNIRTAINTQTAINTRTAIFVNTRTAIFSYLYTTCLNGIISLSLWIPLSCALIFMLSNDF